MKHTAADIRAALKRMFHAPEHAIVYEVAQATGHSARRHLDAVAMDLWPSRGLALHGIEIKVNLYDWRREKADPSKAEEIARFCDYFWVAAPAGLIPIVELPTAWGLIEVDDAGSSQQVKAASKTESVAIGRPFLAAMMRAASRTIDPDTVDAVIAARTAQAEAGIRERVKAEASAIASRRTDAAANWEKLTAAIGENADGWISSPDVIAAVAAVHKAGVASTWQGLNALHDTLTRVAGEVGYAIGAIGIEKPAKKRGRA